MRAVVILVLAGAGLAAPVVESNQTAGQTGPPKVAAQPVLDEPGKATTLAAGSELDLLLPAPLDAGRVAADERFEATAIAAIVQVGSILDLAPATVRGFVSSVRRTGATRSALTLSFEEVRVGASTQRLRGSVVQVFQGRRADISEAAAAGVALNTDRNPLPGVLVTGGTIAATDGKNVVLAPGTVVRIRLEQPIEVRSR
jgi:hypothetical protein